MSQEDQSLNCEPCDQRRGLYTNHDVDEQTVVKMLYRDLNIDFRMLNEKIRAGGSIPGIEMTVNEDKIIITFYYIPENGEGILQHRLAWNDPMKKEIMHISFFPKAEGGVHTTIPSSGRIETSDFVNDMRLYLTNEHILTCMGHGEKYYTLLNYFKTLAHYFDKEKPITRTSENLMPIQQGFINRCLDRKLYPAFSTKEPSREHKKAQLVKLLEALHVQVQELSCSPGIEAQRARIASEIESEREDGIDRARVSERDRERDRERGARRGTRTDIRTDRDRSRSRDRDRRAYRDGSRDWGRRPYEGYGGSTKVVVYSGKIQKLRELNKKLRKHKTKNKTKIEKNNKKIDELKIKIKKEKAKAKEKLKKLKEKEKLKKQKEKEKLKKQKEKEKLKKQKEKLKKQKKVHITKK